MRVAISAKSFGERRVLSDVSFELASGEVLAIAGRSGCGKTTLLRIIAGLDADFAGSIEVPAPIGMVFQEPRLLPWRTVARNVALALPEAVDEDRRRQAAYEALEAVGLAAEAEHFPRALSLGMARRAAIARALVVEPALMLLDEPFVSLDEATAGQLRELLRGLWRSKDMSVIIVTHNLDEAVDLAGRVIVLRGAPATIVEDLHLDAPAEVRTPEWRARQLARLRMSAAEETEPASRLARERLDH